MCVCVCIVELRIYFSSDIEFSTLLLDSAVHIKLTWNIPQIDYCDKTFKFRRNCYMLHDVVSMS